MKIKRYYSLNMYFKGICSHRVGKICVDAGFTCPNRDGTISERGCLFCDEKGSAADYIKRNLPVHEQVKVYLKEKSRGDDRYIVYFQPFTNTYEKAAILKDLYKAVFVNDRIIGISIGTRPDCIDPEKIGIIEDIAENHEVWLEMGLQTSNNKTLRTINRGHTAEDFKNAMELTKGTNIKVCAHVIIGLPGEGPEDYRQTADFLSSLPVRGVKLHHLYIAKGTQTAELYKKGEIKTMGKEEYIKQAGEFLKRIRPDIVIHRLMGDCSEERLIAPLWTRENNSVMDGINGFLKKNNSWQGRDCSSKI